MAEEKVTVTIDGKETVSTATGQASGSLEGFSSKIPGWAKAAAVVAGAYAAVAAAIGAAKDVVLSSFAAWDEAAAVQRKLEASGKLLGVQQDYLNTIVKKGRDEFKLSNAAASEFAIAVATIEKKAGATGISLDLLSAVLDLGAAKGLTASKSLESIQKALIGVDEGTDRLFNKNPSVLYDDFAKAVGRSATKFSDQDKAAALAYATLEAGILVGGSYTEYLESAAGQQEVMNTRMTEAKVTFAETLTPLRLLTLEMAGNLMPILGPIARVLGGALAAAVVTVGKVFNTLYGVIGSVATDLGKLTGNKAMEEWGTRSAGAADKMGRQLNDAGEAAGRAIRGVDDEVKKSATEQKLVEDKRAVMVKQMADLVEAAKKREGQSVKDLEKKYKKQMEQEKETYEMIRKYRIDTDDVVKRLDKSFEKASQTLTESFDKRNIEDTNKVFKEVDDNARKLIDRMKADPLGTLIKTGKDVAKDMSDALGTGAENVLAIGENFGGLDEGAQTVLGRVRDIAGVVGQMAKDGLSWVGVGAIVGGVSTIVSAMMQGDKERRDLTRENTRAMNRLREEGVSLTNSVSGTKMASVANVLTPELARGLGAMDTNFAGSRQRGTDMLVAALAKQGLRLSDLDAVASDLGMNLRRSDGSLQLSQLSILVESLNANMKGFARVGQSFADQFAFFKDSQKIAGSTGTGQIDAMLQFLSGSGGGLGMLQGLSASNPGQLRQRLFEIFTGLNNNTMIPGDFGRLSGTQFRDAIFELIGMVDGLSSDGGGASIDVGGGGGGVSIPTESVQAVVKMMDANLSNILTTHTDLHDRIAKATEGSYERLVSIDGKMSQLIVATADGAATINVRLEALRLVAAANAGRGPSFG